MGGCLGFQGLSQYHGSQAATVQSTVPLHVISSLCLRAQLDLPPTICLPTQGAHFLRLGKLSGNGPSVPTFPAHSRFLLSLSKWPPSMAILPPKALRVPTTISGRLSSIFCVSETFRDGMSLPPQPKICHYQRITGDLTTKPLFTTCNQSHLYVCSHRSCAPLANQL